MIVYTMWDYQQDNLGPEDLHDLEEEPARQAAEAPLHKNRVGEAPARAAETAKTCAHCASEPEPGWIETDNNGPT